MALRPVRTETSLQVRLKALVGASLRSIHARGFAPNKDSMEECWDGHSRGPFDPGRVGGETEGSQGGTGANRQRDRARERSNCSDRNASPDSGNEEPSSGVTSELSCPCCPV